MALDQPEQPVPDDVVARLRAAGCVFAEEEAALLRREARDGEHLERLVTERVAGTPLEQVVGWAELGGARVTVAPGVFVPRRRTEVLVRRAAGLLRREDTVVDLCCGTGAIAAALLAAVPDLEVYAVDVDPTAVDCARRNLPPDRVSQGDLYDALPDRLRGRVDLVAASPPYVPTDQIALMPAEARDHEPRAALDGGDDGLDVVRRVVAGAPVWLRPDGHLLVEVGRSQVDATAALMTAAGFVVEVEDAAEEADETAPAGVVVSGFRTP